MDSFNYQDLNRNWFDQTQWIKSYSELVSLHPVYTVSELTWGEEILNLQNSLPETMTRYSFLPVSVKHRDLKYAIMYKRKSKVDCYKHHSL